MAVRSESPQLVRSLTINGLDDGIKVMVLEALTQLTKEKAHAVELDSDTIMFMLTVLPQELLSRALEYEGAFKRVIYVVHEAYKHDYHSARFVKVCETALHDATWMAALKPEDDDETLFAPSPTSEVPSEEGLHEDAAGAGSPHQSDTEMQAASEDVLEVLKAASEPIPEETPVIADNIPLVAEEDADATPVLESTVIKEEEMKQDTCTSSIPCLHV